MHGFYAVDGPASRRKFVLGIVFLGASRCPPKSVIRYLAEAEWATFGKISKIALPTCGSTGTLSHWRSWPCRHSRCSQQAGKSRSLCSVALHWSCSPPFCPNGHTAGCAKIVLDLGNAFSVATTSAAHYQCAAPNVTRGMVPPRESVWQPDVQDNQPTMLWTAPRRVFDCH